MIASAQGMPQRPYLRQLVLQARNALNQKHSVVCVLGDGGLSGGMAYEALNNIKELKGNFICVLNDNDMSISPPVGAMANYITSIRTTKIYDDLKHKFQRIFDRIPKIGIPLKRRIESTVKRFRSSLLDVPTGVLFEEFGFKYLGPIDGHNLTAVMASLKYAKEYDGPIMIHIITTKGKGMDVAEENPVKYHGVSANQAQKKNDQHSLNVSVVKSLKLLKRTQKYMLLLPQ